jgi:nucleotide-binding universal stress UspA family protein
MSTILVPVDFSPVTNSVIGAAIALASPTGSRIVIMHVLQPPAVVADYGLMGSFVLPVMETMGQAASGQLDRLKARIEARDLLATTVQVTGASSSRLIASEAEKRRADYIVMGSHGHTGFYDLLIGSTTSGVLKRAPCPVVIVPAQKKKKPGKR